MRFRHYLLNYCSMDTFLHCHPLKLVIIIQHYCDMQPILRILAKTHMRTRSRNAYKCKCFWECTGMFRCWRMETSRSCKALAIVEEGPRVLMGFVEGSGCHKPPQELRLDATGIYEGRAKSKGPQLTVHSS